VSSHLSDEQLVGYIHQALTYAQQDAMNRHLATCPHCRRRLADHKALKQRIEHSVLDCLSRARPSPQMTFAIIAPRLKRSRRFGVMVRQSRQLLSGMVALAALIVLVLGMRFVLKDVDSGGGQPDQVHTEPLFPSPPPSTLRIALILPTGSLPLSEAALAAQQGALLAVEQRNDAGGVLGLPVEVVNFDSKCSVEGGQQVAGETQEQNLKFYVGGLCANEAVAVSEEITAEMSVFLSLNANPLVTADDNGKHRRGVHSIAFPETLPAKAMARYAREQLRAQTAAILYDGDSSSSTNLANEFSQVFADDGGEIVEMIAYSGSAEDYAAYLAPVAVASPGVLFLPTYEPQISDVAAQARQMGIEAVLLGWDGWIHVDGQVVRSGYYCTALTTLDPQVRAFLEDCAEFAPLGHEVQAFLETGDARFRSQSTVFANFAALGYDAIRVLLDAVEQAGTTEVASVQQVLLDSTFQGLTGPIDFDQNGQAYRDLALVEIKDGEHRFVAYISP
jgi:branched-chain amino acid transport system substrate-binding protein